MFYQKKLVSSTVFVFDELEEIPGFEHAFTLRQTVPSGKEADRLQTAVSPHPALIRELGLKIGQLILMEQVHSNRVLVAPAGAARQHPRTVGPADGLITVDRGQFPAVRSADCVPLLLVLPRAGRLCVLHAGWRGTLARIAARGTGQFLETTGSPASELIAALGPSIRSCCYQVGGEVRERFSHAGHDLSRLFRKDHLDLVEANRTQLQQLGVKRVLDSGMCTACRTDLFYSYRREGETGRNWALGGFHPPHTQ